MKSSQRKICSSHRSAGFTLVEAMVALGVTLAVLSGVLLLFGQARASLRVEPELSAMRLDARAALDRIAADLVRAGSGLPAEVPVFAELGHAGDQNPDGLDFLAAPARLAEASFEPVIGFDGTEVILREPESRLARPGGGSRGEWVVVFNDDVQMPRWVFGRVTSVSAGSGGGVLDSVTGAVGKVASAVNTAQGKGGDDGEEAAPPEGAKVRIAPLDDEWHSHFRPSVDGDTFAPGSGGGVIERTLQSLLGGAIDAVLPTASGGVVSEITSKVLTEVVEGALKKKGVSLGGGDDDEEATPEDGYGLYGLGQPGIVPASRIRYWVRAAGGDSTDGRSVLMRQLDEEVAQPVGFVEDLQVRYLTGRQGDVAHDAPPPFIGDSAQSMGLADHVVRAVEISVTVRSVGRRLAAASESADEADDFLRRTYRRRVGVRIAAAGAGRRAWEQEMQWSSIPTEIPKIGPLRYIPWP